MFRIALKAKFIGQVEYDNMTLSNYHYINFTSRHADYKLIQISKKRKEERKK